MFNGKYPANREIKSFLLKHNHIKETGLEIEFQPSFILQAPNGDDSIGGYTESDKNGNILIVICPHSTQRSDSSLAVFLAHEICHQMVNQGLCDQLKNNNESPKHFTSAEVEALCDVVGLIAAKGSGYDIKKRNEERIKDYKQVIELSVARGENIDDIIDKLETLYMPIKLMKLAEFIDKKYL